MATAEQRGKPQTGSLLIGPDGDVQTGNGTSTFHMRGPPPLRPLERIRRTTRHALRHSPMANSVTQENRLLKGTPRTRRGATRAPLGRIRPRLGGPEGEKKRRKK